MHLLSGVVKAVKTSQCGNVSGHLSDGRRIWLRPQLQDHAGTHKPGLCTKVISKKRYLGGLTYIFNGQQFCCLQIHSFSDDHHDILLHLPLFPRSHPPTATITATSFVILSKRSVALYVSVQGRGGCVRVQYH